MSDKGWTPLIYCVSSRVGRDSAKKRKDLARTARTLLDHRADTRPAPSTGLSTAAIQAVLEMLLEAGGACADDDTLNHAACEGHFDALELLLKYGARLDGTRGTDHHGGYTPLGCAVSCRSMQGTQWFLEKDQDPNKIKSKVGGKLPARGGAFRRQRQDAAAAARSRGKNQSERQAGTYSIGAGAGERSQEGDCLSGKPQAPGPSVPSQKYVAIVPPIHPGSRRCLHSPYTTGTTRSRRLVSLAPRQPNCVNLSLRRDTSSLIQIPGPVRHGQASVPLTIIDLSPGRIPCAFPCPSPSPSSSAPRSRDQPPPSSSPPSAICPTARPTALRFGLLRDRINAEDLAFVLHVGDIKGGGSSL